MPQAVLSDIDLVPERGTVVRFPRRKARRPKAGADQLHAILDALDIRLIGCTETRREHETTASEVLRKMIAVHGAEHVTLVLRTIRESRGNERALTDPIINAVSAVALAFPAWPATGLRWIEAFDQVPLVELYAKARPLKYATRCAGWSFLAGMIVERLYPIFAEQKIAPPKRVNLPKRPVAGARRIVENGLELLPHKGPHNTSPIPRDVCDRLGISVSQAGFHIRAARLYGARPELVERLRPGALRVLIGPSFPAAIRAEVEKRLADGEKFSGRQLQRMAGITTRHRQRG